MISIRELARANRIKPDRRLVLNLAELVQESYTLYYDLQDHPNKKLSLLGESLIADIQSNPNDLERLTEDFTCLDQLAMLEQITLPAGEPRDQVVMNRKSRHRERLFKEASETVAWEEFKPELENFIDYTNGKVFVKGLNNFNTVVANGEEITPNLLIELHKALNSTLTHLSVELEKNPDFQETYSRITQLLQKDNLKVSNAIAQGTELDKNTIKDILAFSNLILSKETEMNPIYESYDPVEDEEYIDLEDDEADPEDEQNIDDLDILPPDDLEDDGNGFIIDITKQELDTILDVLERIALVATDDDNEEDLRSDFNDMLGGEGDSLRRSHGSFGGGTTDLDPNSADMDDLDLENDLEDLEEPQDDLANDEEAE